ncbi:NF038122 family metalloprotease [Phenylobacterium sp.]|jgi:hypothetical protein|uniref:NF038122 family metalloprotease n=1 Tax=Phenylobacterium sp. TaxID=1871053 RepID=UPI002E327261|nr:NF038122 family metalloprotease [Phenylobacterium sp.]HEX3364233.1 NF038122 family metalloprotease [Phenylobacterium sp.]
MSRSGLSKSRLLGGLAGAVALAAASQGHALTIIASFDSSITSASNAAAIEASINSALQFYGDFSNPVTVKIGFSLMNSGLGASNTGIYTPTYAQYTAALAADSVAHPGNTVLQTGVANLPFGNDLPDVGATSADMRALGFSAPGIFSGGADGLVSLDASIMNFGDTAIAGLYGANSVIQHEVDEVLGVGGPGSLIGQGGFPNTVGAEDLYRYAGFHAPTLSATTPAYFSINGGLTDLHDYNVSGSGDLADWNTPSCSGTQFVQNAFGCSGQPQFGLTLSSPEVVALQAIGYNLVASIPEPSAWTLMIAGFGMMGAMLRRRRGLATA